MLYYIPVAYLFYNWKFGLNLWGPLKKGFESLFTLRYSRQFQKAPFKNMSIFQICVFTQSSKHFKTIILTVLGRNAVSVTSKQRGKRKYFIQTDNFGVT